MHTMVVQMSIEPAGAGAVTRHFQEDVVSWARQQPGFVSGQWLLNPGGNQGLGVVVFATEDAAITAARGPRSYSRDDGRPWNIENVDVYEVVTTAAKGSAHR
jgi:hypothetical protein